MKLLGGSGSPGVDLLIGTQRYELATQTQPGSLLGALQRKVNSSTRGAAGSHILIDGRGFTDVAQAKLAIDHAKGLQTFMNNPVPITIFVRGVKWFDILQDQTAVRQSSHREDRIGRLLLLG